MPRTISGPHFGVGATLNFADLLFEELRSACRKHGGVLGLADIDAVAEESRNKAVENFGLFDKSFDRAAASLAENHGRRFSAGTGARFAVFSVCTYAIDEAFARQREAARDWGMAFCDALIDRDAQFCPGYVARIDYAYRVLACRLGDDLDVKAFAQAEEVRRPTRAFVAALLHALDDPGQAKVIENGVNLALSRKYDIVAPHPLLANGLQMRTFADRLWEDFSHGLA